MLIIREYISARNVSTELDKLFVFGDNMAGQGRGGQAKVMRGKPNTVGIPTKWTPTTDLGAYFHDSDLVIVRWKIDAAFDRLEAHLNLGGDVVWPAAGVGSGRARLSEKAPAIVAYIQQRYERLTTIGTSADKKETK